MPKVKEVIGLFGDYLPDLSSTIVKLVSFYNRTVAETEKSVKRVNGGVLLKAEKQTKKRDPEQEADTFSHIWSPTKADSLHETRLRSQAVAK